MTRKNTIKKKTSVLKIPAKKTKKVIPIKRAIISQKESNTEKILIENFVSLQKVMVNLSVKFDNLSTQISRLLNLFEISAKALAEKGADMEVDNKEVIEKIDDLSKQNKLIARGLSLIHEGRVGQDFPPSPTQRTPQIPKFSPTSPPQESVVEQNQNIKEQQRITEANQNPETYQKSSLSKFKPLPKE